MVRDDGRAVPVADFEKKQWGTPHTLLYATLLYVCDHKIKGTPVCNGTWALALTWSPAPTTEEEILKFLDPPSTLY